MQLLKEIFDKPIPKDLSDIKVREASRAILFDDNNLVPLMFVSQHNYHKLPGGGIEEGEDKIKALVREILEEVGSEIEVKEEIGKIVEYRFEYKLKQTSYCYLGKVISKGTSNYTRKEKEQGFELIWVPLNKAIELVENDNTTEYSPSFIRKRDLVFLKQASRIIKQKA